MLARMSEQERRALFLVGAFLIAIVVYTQAIEPLVFRFQNALGRLERSEQLSAGYIQKIRMLPRREARLAELEQEKSAVDTYFKVSPASRSAPAETLIDELSSYASITGVTIRQLVPNVESLDGGGGFHDLVLLGDYAALRQYLYLLETSPRKFQLTEFELNPPKEGILRSRVRFLDPAEVLSDNPESKGSDVDPDLIIGVYGTEDDLPIYLAQTMGFFNEVQLKVGLVPAGTPDTSLRRLLSGQVDVTTASLYDILRYRLGGVPVRAIMPISRVPLEVQLATSTDSGVSTLEDLQGKTVALEPHGMVEPLFLQLLAANELGRDDVNLVHLDRRDLVRHLRSGLVDASLISGLEPGRLEYFGLSPVEKLKTARKTWQSFLIVHADALEQEKIPLTQLARAVFRANHMLQENSEQVAAAANQWLGRNNNQPAGPVIEKIRFPDSQDAWNLMSTAEDNVIGLAMFQQLLLELGEDVPDVTTRDLVNNTILDKLRTEHLDED